MHLLLVLSYYTPSIPGIGMSTRHIFSLTPFAVWSVLPLFPAAIAVVGVFDASPSTISITTILLLFDVSTEFTTLTSCLSMISFSTLIRLCLSFTNSANRLVSGIFSLISIFLVGGDGVRPFFGETSMCN